MLSIKDLNINGYEQVVEGIDPDSGLHCFIAIHDTRLGPAMGGTRFYPYADREAALNDALRLAKAMTYKSALAEDGLGGGKSVIIGDPRTRKSEDLFHSFGAVINYLKGNYIAAEDVGTRPEDMEVLRRSTPYVAALPSEKSSGDPSRFTAWGIYRGMQAIARKLWGTNSLRGKKIAIQGLGSVGGKLANILFWEGADLILTDLDPGKLTKYMHLYGAEIVNCDNYCSVNCDILAPCALGGIINEKTITELKCKAVAGSANNQLSSSDLGKLLFQKKILYAPDYVINSGGIINASIEFNPEGYDPKLARDKVNRIYDTLLNIFEKSKKERRPTSEVADEIAEYNLKNLIGRRETQIKFQVMESSAQ